MSTAAPTIAPPITEQDIEEFVKSLHSEHDDIKCNSRAEHDCTVQAVAKATCDCTKESRFWCQGRYDINAAEWGMLTCEDCGRNAEDCWKVILI